MFLYDDVGWMWGGGVMDILKERSILNFFAKLSRSHCIRKVIE